jgi:DNA polymerase I-like protein with 3'-5' exonuclease and polymerase domains
MVSYALKRDDGETSFHYHTDIDFLTRLREAVAQAKLIIGFNGKFESHWARRHGIVPPAGCRIWDCQIAEFIISGQTGAYPSLNDALARFDLGQKDDRIAEYWALGVDTPDIPVDELKFYNILDVELTYKLYLRQLEEMSAKQQRLCTVQGLDLLVLADMEWNGVHFNIDLCKKKAYETETALAAISSNLSTYIDGNPNFNWDSGYHLSCLIYGGAFSVDIPIRQEQLVYKSGKRKGEEYTKTYWETRVYRFERRFTPGNRSKTKLVSKVGSEAHPIYSTGADELKQLRSRNKADRLLIELLLKRAELAKLLDTYYGAIPKLLETMEWGNVLHGQYNQVVAATGRLSSSNPNMQNFSGEADELLVSRFV